MKFVIGLEWLSYRAQSPNSTFSSYTGTSLCTLQIEMKILQQDHLFSRFNGKFHDFMAFLDANYFEDVKFYWHSSKIGCFVFLIKAI